MELASRKNNHPLPPVEKKGGFRLPPDHQCLLAANYKITTLRNVGSAATAAASAPGRQGENEEAAKRLRVG